MSNVYLIASTEKAARDQLAEMRARTRDGSLVLPVDTNMIPIFRESDLRGRTVDPDDTVVVCGDWSSRQAGEVQHLVAMFNSRRGGKRAVALEFRIGEAPQPVFPEPVPDPIVIRTMGGATHTINPASSASAVAWNQVLAPADQRILQDAQDAVGRERAIAQDMRAQVKKANAEVERVTIENRELRSWLSGVLPVEDSEIPGCFWCGICGHRLGGTYEHLDGCPAAP